MISVNIDGIDCREVKLYVDEDRAINERAYGGYDEKTHSFFIGINQHTTVGELLTTILHEICHHVLKKIDPGLDSKQEDFYIYYAELECMNNLIESQKGEGGNSPYYPYSDDYYTSMRNNFIDNVFMPIYRYFFLGKKTSVFLDE